jgi:hypothetical protein
MKRTPGARIARKATRANAGAKPQLANRVEIQGVIIVIGQRPHWWFAAMSKTSERPFTNDSFLSTGVRSFKHHGYDVR